MRSRADVGVVMEAVREAEAETDVVGDEEAGRGDAQPGSRPAASVSATKASSLLARLAIRRIFTRRQPGYLPMHSQKLRVAAKARGNRGLMQAGRAGAHG